MSRRTQLFAGLIALLIAAGSGLLAYSWFDQMVTVAQIITPARVIPAGALIRADMLSVREVARPLLRENIYVRPEELAGQVAVVTLYPGMVIYKHFAVPLSEYRLVDDPTLEVVSFPISPGQAVGGQLQPGHRIDIWKMISVRPLSANLAEIAAGSWATATLLAESVLVVDVRTASGSAVARSPQAVPGDQRDDQSPSRSSGALQILTVAVPRDQAREILHLVAMESGGARIWVTLAPVR